MASRRTLKAAQAIKEVVGMAILTQIKDPRIQGVNVTNVEVAADMRNAKVYVLVRGGEAQEKLALRGLQSACGFLQQQCAQQIDTRYTPRLQFCIDEGVKNLIAVSQILEEEKRSQQTSEDEELDDSEEELEDEDEDSGESANLKDGDLTA